MGREIRMVPPNWEHPKKWEHNPRKGWREVHIPMYDRPYRPALEEWFDGWQKWERGEYPSYTSDDCKGDPYWEYTGGPPQPEYYRPDWKPEEMTWYQVYQTVSEGTPVTPPFATKEELIDYLVENGDFWDQERRKDGDSIMRCTPWPREEAEAFVNGPGWAPSMVIANGKCMTGTEALAQQPTPPLGG